MSSECAWRLGKLLRLACSAKFPSVLWSLSVIALSVLVEIVGNPWLIRLPTRKCSRFGKRRQRWEAGDL
jgi:hypothetical protein